MLGALLYDKGHKIGKRTCRVCSVLVLLMALALTLVLARTPVLMGWEGFYDLSGGSGDLDIRIDVNGWINGRMGYNLVA